MVSFLLSLVVVDRQQRAWRLSQHAPHPDSFWSRFSLWTWIHDPEPYQDPQDTTWQHGKHHEQHTTIQGNVPIPGKASDGNERWYTRKKHRKMARLEITDAFSMQGKMALLLIFWALLGLIVVVWSVWCVRKLWAGVTHL